MQVYILLVYQALSYWCEALCYACIRMQADDSGAVSSVCGLKLLVYAALSYSCMRP
jgi:hypothetical protein